MRTRITVTGVVLALALTVVNVTPAARGWTTTEVSTPLGDLSLQIEDASFDVASCTRVPVYVSVTTLDSRTSWTLDLDAVAAPETSDDDDTASLYVYGSGSSYQKDEFFVCPYMGWGKFTVTGTLTMRNYRAATEATVPVTTSFTMSKLRTTTELSTPRIGDSLIIVSGTVFASTDDRGKVGLRKWIDIEARMPGRDRWVVIDSIFSRKDGTFTTTIDRRLPANASFRATFDGDSTFEASTSSIRSGKACVTYRQYKRAKFGMTMRQVADIFVTKGKETSRSTSYGVTIEFRSYEGCKPYSTISIMFTNGRLDSKSQVGL